MNSAVEGQDVSARPASKIAVWCETFAVGIVFTVFVVFRAADRVFIKRVQNMVSNPTYNLMISNIFWPVSVQILTIVMLMLYVLYQRRQGNKSYSWRFFLPGNVMASSLGAVPMYQMALFSLGDQINAAMQAPPSPFINQTMQSVMTNTVVLWMAIFAFFWLKTRFHQVHYIGCVLIVISCIVGVSNQLQNNNCTPEGLQSDECLIGYKDSSGLYHMLTAGGMVTWYAIFLGSMIPNAVSNLYKQKVLKGRDVDICYATWWSGNFQVLWGFALLWVIWIPLPGQETPTPGQLPQSIADTWQCFIGNVPHVGDETCASGSMPAIFWFGIYLMFNLSFNVCLLWLTKRMSAMWAQIATVLCLDLTNIFGTIPFLAGGAAIPMGISGWLATAIASLSLWVYNLEEEKVQNKDYGNAERLGLSASIISCARAPLIDQFGNNGHQGKEQLLA